MPFTKPANIDGTHKQSNKNQTPKPDLFGGIHIGLIKATPSPTKLFSFTFINFLNYRLTTPVSMLVWSGNKTKWECTAVHGKEIRFMNSTCHQHFFLKSSSSSKNKLLPNANKIYSLIKESCKLTISATQKCHQVTENSAQQSTRAVTFYMHQLLLVHITEVSSCNGISFVM